MAALLEEVIPRRVLDGAATREAPIDRRIAARMAAVAREAPLEATLRSLIADDLDSLPLPGHGATLERWQSLEQVARHDLSLVKLFEGHTDALAIIAEIDPLRSPTRGVLYGVWASEARVDPLTIDADAPLLADARVTITGRKSWCSGADIVDAALMTATAADGTRHLVEIDPAAPGIRIDRDCWHAVGMRRSGSFDVVCEHVEARVVGGVDAYLRRPGFWHGGAGIAACWFGAAAAIGTRVRDLQRGREDVHALAHLGAIDAALATSAALLRECALAIDASPGSDAMRTVLRVRGAVADACERVIADAARAIGPGPLCNEPDLAQRVADLPVFVRQSRAEHDLVAQSRALLADESELISTGWRL
jgi:alkylation response protein AidB-like acyl-CoA dehydrogenase